MTVIDKPIRKPRKNRHSSAIVKRTVKRAVKYRRVSVIRDNMTTMETQDELITEYCNASNRKWEIVADLGDPGISAYSGKNRPDFEKAIRMIETGQADAIVVFRLDRFSRSIGEFWEAWERIKAAGGTFVSVTENFDTSSDFGEMMLLILAAFAQMESRAKSERAIPMHDFQKENGYVPGGPRPYGYDRIKSKGKAKDAPKDENGRSIGAILTINETEAELIRTAAKYILNGGTLKGFINEHQPTSSQSRKEMTAHGLKYVLINPTTAGLRQLTEGGFSKGCWEPILDRKDWDALRTILLDPSRVNNQTNSINQGTQYLLSGLLTCGKCGGTCYSRNWTHTTTGKKSMRYCCRQCSVSMDMDTVDGLVLNHLMTEVPQSKWESWKTSGMGWNPEILADLENRLMAFDRQFDSGNMSESRWLMATANIQEQMKAATNNEPIMDLPDIDNLADGFDGLELSDKRQVIKQAFRSINLNPFGGIHRQAERIVCESNVRQ